MMTRLFFFAFAPLAALLVGCAAPAKDAHSFAIKDLDRRAVFSFSIISDNKGGAPSNSKDMRRCDAWIREAGDQFILGLGDHVKINRENPFLELIRNDALWHHHFYPNVADGENEFWGAGQGDYGAGKPILQCVDLAARPGVRLRDNQCEYYAVEEHDGIRVHIIQLHYPDTPKDPDRAFRKDSRAYLMNTLAALPKGPNDIIIVLAHTDHWIEVLDRNDRERLLRKADLILDANRHIYRRYHLGEDAPANGALVLNSGSVGNSPLADGFLQIHVLRAPLRMIIQYQTTRHPHRMLQHGSRALEKVIGGPTTEVDWSQFSN